MRVTENTNYGAAMESIRRSKERMEQLQAQSASLKKVNQPSDDPIAASKILELRTVKVNNDQFQGNGGLAKAFLANTETAVSDLTELVQRLKEIAISQASSASSSEETRRGVAEEVTQLFHQAVSIANRKIGDRYLLGGFKTQKPPVDVDGNYAGDQGQMMVEVGSNVFIAMNIPGDEIFNTQTDSAREQQGMFHPQDQSGGIVMDAGRDDDPTHLENVNVFDEIQNLRIALLTGDVENIRGTLERLDQLHGKLVSVRAKIGSRIQGIESTLSAIERHNITGATLTSALEDADMAQVMSDLAKEESVFRSSLASAKRLVQPSLMDFLR